MTVCGICKCMSPIGIVFALGDGPAEPFCRRCFLVVSRNEPGASLEEKLSICSRAASSGLVVVERQST